MGKREWGEREGGGKGRKRMGKRGKRGKKGGREREEGKVRREGRNQRGIDGEHVCAILVSWGESPLGPHGVPHFIHQSVGASVLSFSSKLLKHCARRATSWWLCEADGLRGVGLCDPLTLFAR